MLGQTFVDKVNTGNNKEQNTEDANFYYALLHNSSLPLHPLPFP